MPDDVIPDSAWMPNCKVARSAIERVTITGPATQATEVAAKLESEGWKIPHTDLKPTKFTIIAEREAPMTRTTEAPAQSVGDKLRKAREAAGLDRRAFARAIGMSYSYLSDIEKDRRAALRDQTIVKVAVGIGVSPHTIKPLMVRLEPGEFAAIRAELGIKEADLEAAREAWKNSRLNKSKEDS